MRLFKALVIALVGLAIYAIPTQAQNLQSRVTAVCETISWTWTADDLGRQVAIDTKGRLCVVQTGNIAGGATDAGNPVKIGCVYNTTPPTYTNAQRTDCQSGTRGGIVVQLTAPNSLNSPVVDSAALADGASNTQTRMGTADFPFLFNGSTWDRDFTCPNSTAVSVTAGSTTEIVPLTSSQIIRICGFSLSMSAAGTAAIVYGTGTNCGTGTTTMSGAVPLATGTPWSISAGKGAVLRNIASNAVCVTAATGNVIGFLNWVKY
jgi:hypothetical protein